MKSVIFLFLILIKLLFLPRLLGQEDGSIRIDVQINEITHIEYANLLEQSGKSNIESSSILKRVGSVEIPTNNGILLLKDNFQSNCQACIIEYEVLGEIRSLGKVIIEEYHFRNSIILLIDRHTGIIDTLESGLFFSPDLTFLINSNPISKDSVIGGFRIFGIMKKSLMLQGEIKTNWRINEMNWIKSGEMLVKANPVENGVVQWNDYEFYKLVMP